MRRVRPALLVLPALVFVLAAAPAASASSFWGVGAEGMLEQPAATKTMQLNVTRGAGVTLGRFPVSVDSDNQLSALAAHGIEPYPTLADNYGEFAARYGDGGSYWTAAVDPVHIYEIGNEPNIANDPAKYAATYRAARSEIRAQDPRADVVAGGLAAIYPKYHFDVYDWIRQMITALGYCPDAVGYHAYPASLGQLQTGVTKFRQALDDVNCEPTGIELNEFYVVGGDPELLAPAVKWLVNAHLGVSRLILSLWCARSDTLIGPPAEGIDGTILPSGQAFLATMETAPDNAAGAPPAQSGHIPMRSPASSDPAPLNPRTSTQRQTTRIQIRARHRRLHKRPRYRRRHHRAKHEHRSPRGPLAARLTIGVAWHPLGSTTFRLLRPTER